MEVGALVFKIQADECSAKDIKDFLRELVQDSKLRERCTQIGQLNSKMQENRRKEYCLSMARIMLASVEPPVPGKRIDPIGIGMALRSSSLLKNGKWVKHIHAGVGLSEELYDMLRALEEMWSVPSFLCTK